MLKLFNIFFKQQKFVNFDLIGILRENHIPTGNINTISLSASQNYIFCHVKALLHQMGPYETNQYTECVSEDESEDNVDETMVYLRVLYFYLYNLKITKIWVFLRKLKWRYWGSNYGISPTMLFLFIYNLKIKKILIKRSLVNAILIKLYEIYIKNLTYSTI